MSDNIQVLEGRMYASTENGYVNRGRETIRLKGKVNFLSVFSRCNQLLKHEEHKVDPRVLSNKLDKVYCSSLVTSPSAKQSSCDKGERQFSAKVNLLRKNMNVHSIQSEDQRSEPICHSETAIHISSEGEHQKQYGKKLVKMPSFSAECSISKKQVDIYQQLEEERNLRLNLEKEYNNLLEQALKHKYNPSESENQRPETRRKPAMMTVSQALTKKTKVKMLTNEDSDEDGGETMRPQEEEEDPIDASFEEASDRITCGLSELHAKIDHIVTNMKIQEQRLKCEILQRELARKDQDILKLSSQNISLKSPNRGIQAAKSHSNQSLMLFIMFVLGMLLTKAFFC